MSFSKKLCVVAAAMTCGIGGLAGVSASTVAATGLIHAPVLRSSTSTSTNWSGYASESGPFTSVSASWVEPTATCSSKKTYAAFWVGIDGDGSDSVEQTGSEADCNKGVASYYAWYEMYPAGSVEYSNTVKPGDHFSASVTTPGKGSSFTLTITDSTEGWTQTQVKSYSAAELFSAEIIAEAPSNILGILPLTDYGTVTFTNAKANGEPIGDLSPQAITMESGSEIESVPTGLKDAEDFRVSWKNY